MASNHDTFREQDIFPPEGAAIAAVQDPAPAALLRLDEGAAVCGALPPAWTAAGQAGGRLASGTCLRALAVLGGPCTQTARCQACRTVASLCGCQPEEVLPVVAAQGGRHSGADLAAALEECAAQAGGSARHWADAACNGAASGQEPRAVSVKSAIEFSPVRAAGIRLSQLAVLVADAAVPAPLLAGIVRDIARGPLILIATGRSAMVPIASADDTRLRGLATLLASLAARLQGEHHGR